MRISGAGSVSELHKLSMNYVQYIAEKYDLAPVIMGARGKVEPGIVQPVDLALLKGSTMPSLAVPGTRCDAPLVWQPAAEGNRTTAPGS
jgi:hypothetical protein